MAFGVVSFDGTFEPVKIALNGADRVFAWDSENDVSAAFTLEGIKNFVGGGDWSTIGNKPETFAPSAHTLGSHSDTLGLDEAPDGSITRKISGKWAAAAPPWAMPGDIPNVPSWVLGITETDIENWDTAFGWGDHALAGYLTTETDPSVPAWVKAITELEKANWTVAFGWGNHADAGYITTEGDPVFTASPAAGISMGNISVWNVKTFEYASFADGDTPMILNGEAKISGLTAQLTENPFDPETEEEDYLAWTPTVESFTFPVVVKGVPAVEDDEFVTKGQMEAGGTDSNAVHYNASDGKSATEKQQARDNLGLPTGIPTILTLSANVNTMSRSTNLIVFEGHTILRNVYGLIEGTDGEKVYFWNRGEYPIRPHSEHAASPAANRFNFAPASSYDILPGELIGFTYNATQQRWNFEMGLEKYIRKDIADVKHYPLEIKTVGINTANSLNFWNIGGRTTISGTRNGTHVPSIRFDNSSMLIGNDKGSAAVFGVHIEITDTVHLGKTGNGGNTSLPAGYQVGSTTGHYFNADASFFGRTDRLLSITTAGSINDLDTTGMSNVRLTDATVLTGIMAPAVIGKRLTIQNDNSVPLEILHQSTSSIAANRINLIGGSTLSVPPKGKTEFIYCFGSRWELVSKNF